MPEHQLPEIDLDRAFDSLTRDLAGRPGAPGAGAAVATARRRRRTAIASVGALAVLVVGAAALPQLTGGSGPDRSTDVAGGDPLTFSGAALTDATEGWTGPWREPTSGDELEGVQFGEPTCLDELPGAGDNVEPRRVGDAMVLAEGTSTGAYVSFAEFRTTGGVATMLDNFSPAAVEAACGVATDEVTVGGTEVRHAHLGAAGKSPAADWWLAADGARLAMLVIVAPEGGAPARVQADVAALLDRALDEDDNFEPTMTRVESSSGGGSSASGGSSGEGEVPSFPALTREAVTEATGGWPAQIRSTDDLSCTGQFSLERMEWQSWSSDHEGTTTTHSGFVDARAASDAVDQVAAQLEGCVQLDWRITTGTSGNGRTLSAGSSDGTLVLAQRGATLAWVTVGEPDVPAPAVQAIVSLLHDTIVAGSEAPKR